MADLTYSFLHPEGTPVKKNLFASMTGAAGMGGMQGPSSDTFRHLLEQLKVGGGGMGNPMQPAPAPPMGGMAPPPPEMGMGGGMPPPAPPAPAAPPQGIGGMGSMIAQRMRGGMPGAPGAPGMGVPRMPAPPAPGPGMMGGGSLGAGALAQNPQLMEFLKRQLALRQQG